MLKNWLRDASEFQFEMINSVTKNRASAPEPIRRTTDDFVRTYGKHVETGSKRQKIKEH